MLQVHPDPPLRQPLLISAFEGWNDAGEAASRTLAHLAQHWQAVPFAELNPEDYYDYQVNRPRVSRQDGHRTITWPTTRFLLARRTGLARDVVLLEGIEPSTKWQQFAREIVGVCQQLDIATVVALGSMLTDVPHTRPLPVTATTETTELAASYRATPSHYEGITGIVGVLSEATERAGIPTVGAWVAVPHYAGGLPAPKATVALVEYLESVLGVTIPHADLVEEAAVWQGEVDSMAGDEDEMAEYVRSLERARDTAELPEASGDAIALEFERYLKGQDEPGTPGRGTPE